MYRRRKRRSPSPPPEELPQTGWRTVFFPFSIVALSFMAVMALIGAGWKWIESQLPPDDPPIVSSKSANPSVPSTQTQFSTAPFNSSKGLQPQPQWERQPEKPAEKPVEKPAGGIVIEK